MPDHLPLRRAAVAISAATIAAVILAAPPARPAHAAPGAIALVANDGTFSFAEQMAFRLEVTADAPVTDVVLRFVVGGVEVVNRRVPEFTPGPRVVARHVEPSPRGAIPPSSEIVWWWDVASADGATLQTPRRTLRYLDQRHAWTHLDADGVRLWSYSLDEGEAAELAASAVASLERIEREVGLGVDQTVHIVAYDSQEALRPALLGRGETYESRLATLGARVADDVVVLDAGSRSVALDTVLRHELTHVAVHLRMDEPWVDVPSWLDEGLAMYLEGGFGAGERRALERATRDDALMSLRSMTSFPGDASQVTLAYAQSRDVIAYLIDTHGRERLTALFDRLAPGDATIDDALEDVYGVDQLGLYQAYRAARDLPPAATPPPDAIPPGLAGDAPAGGAAGGDDAAPAAGAPTAGRGLLRLVLPAAAALIGLVALATLVLRTGRGRSHAAAGDGSDDPGAPDRPTGPDEGSLG